MMASTPRQATFVFSTINSRGISLIYFIAFGGEYFVLWYCDAVMIRSSNQNSALFSILIRATTKAETTTKDKDIQGLRQEVAMLRDQMSTATETYNRKVDDLNFEWNRKFNHLFNEFLSLSQIVRSGNNGGQGMLPSLTHIAGVQLHQPVGLQQQQQQQQQVVMQPMAVAMLGKRSNPSECNGGNKKAKEEGHV